MSSTVHIEESVRIARPPEEVWAAIADYSFDREWRDGLSEMTPDPPGPPADGTRDVEPGHSYRFAGSGTIGGVAGGRTVRPDPPGSGALFTYAIELEPRGGMRLLGPLLGPLVRSGLKKDLRKLKLLLEAPS